MTVRAPIRLAASALSVLLLTACFLAPPVSVGKKESLVGQGMVLVVTNTSGDHLHDVTVDIESPSGEKKQYTVATLDPHDSISVGWLKLDGWPIPEGSTVRVSCKGFAVSAGPFRL